MAEGSGVVEDANGRAARRALRLRRPAGGLVVTVTALALLSGTGLSILGAPPVSAANASLESSATASATVNPPGNVIPCSSTWLAAIDCARAGEGLGPLPVSLHALDAMSVPEQLFTLTDYERVARGLAPFTAMTARLVATAQAGASRGGDPPLSALNADSWIGGVWSGGLASAPGAMYEWMYADGLYTPSRGGNIDCVRSGDAGCWGHRDDILRPSTSCSTGPAPSLTLGAATDRTVDGGSIAMTMLISCSGTAGTVTYTWAKAQAAATGASAKTYVALVPTPQSDGYWEATATGAVHAFGGAASYGTLSHVALVDPIVGMAATNDGKGYWLVASDGGIFSFGDARFHGSIGGKPLVDPIVGMATDPATGGYWLVAADGGIFSFGAPFFGSAGGHPLVEPVVGMAAAPGGKGYWLVARDGGVFSFGDAPFHGSTGGRALAEPVVGMAADPATGGYWLATAGGGVFSFDAPFHGSLVGSQARGRVVSLSALPDGSGYWMGDVEGGVFTFGSAGFYGSAA